MYALILQNHFFSDALHLVSNKLFYLTEELILEETKIATIIIDEQSHGSSIQQKTLQHKVEIPTVLGQGSPSFRNVLAKMWLKSNKYYSVLLIKPFFLLIDIHHNQCTRWFCRITFFLMLYIYVTSSFTSPKNWFWRKLKLLPGTIIIDEQPHGSSVQRKTLQHKVAIPMVLGQGSPSFRNVLAKMCYLHRRPPPTHYFNRNPARHITHHFLIRAKRVSNYYIPNKKFVRVRATNIGFRGILQTLLL